MAQAFVLGRAAGPQSFATGDCGTAKLFCFEEAKNQAKHPQSTTRPHDRAFFAPGPESSIYAADQNAPRVKRCS